MILSDSGNFPTDLYMAEGLSALLARPRLRWWRRKRSKSRSTSVAVLMLTEVDYRTGRRHDMARADRTRACGRRVTVWDLAHSAGALPVDLAGAGADFAVGCGYKYLNGGPGAPAFI